MKFGMFMVPLHPPRRSFAESYERDIELIVQADRLGVHEAWVGEHITEMWENAPVPELLIAEALGKTDNIVMGTGVTMLPLHHPVDTAHRIAMLDHMARGRFYWGIGVRSLATDLHLYGIEYQHMDEVRERGREALEIILGLWAAEDGHFGYEGKYYQVHAPDTDPKLERRLYYKPYQKPHPPIGVAASSIKSGTARLAGEKGWIPMSTGLLAHDLKDHWQLVEDGATSTGQVADRSQWRVSKEVYVGETPKSAREEARIVLGQPFTEHRWLNQRVQGTLARYKKDPSMPDEAVDVDYMLDNVWIVGDPQECTDQIRQLYEDVGGFGCLLVITQDPDDHSLMQRSTRLLMEEVAPLLKDLG
jgi:alkanesulfonate monooxygenase SsuD/methylene tetrahydromethanopterin reductase-like flavin-dependent oxidoreductase (luciferase family)